MCPSIDLHQQRRQKEVWRYNLNSNNDICVVLELQSLEIVRDPEHTTDHNHHTSSNVSLQPQLPREITKEEFDRVVNETYYEKKTSSPKVLYIGEEDPKTRHIGSVPIGFDQRISTVINVQSGYTSTGIY